MSRLSNNLDSWCGTLQWMWIIVDLCVYYNASQKKLTHITNASIFKGHLVGQFLYQSSHEGRLMTFHTVNNVMLLWHYHLNCVNL